MPIKIRVGLPGGDDTSWSITLDAPRIVLGRGEGCEVRIPDRSVSARHATIRQRGRDYVIIDEGSTNGTRLGAVTLAAQAPRVLGPREVVRVGRVFVDIEKTNESPTLGAPSRAREIALTMVGRALELDGEDPRPLIRIVEGPDEGKELRLDLGAVAVVGRAKDAELTVADDSASRRHVELKHQGETIIVKDLGSRGGGAVDGVELGTDPIAWKRGQRLEIGANVLTWSFPGAEGFATIERMPDEKVPPSQLAHCEGPEIVAEDPIPEDIDASIGTEDLVDEPANELEQRELALAIEQEERRSRRGSWSLTDFAVLLLAMGVFSLSAVGYFVLLK